MNVMNASLKLATLTLAAVTMTGCSNEGPHAAPSPETVRNVSVLAVQSGTVPDLAEAVGTVRPVQSSDLSSQMMGNIVAIRVREGDRVQRGQVLAVIDDAQPRAALDRATAAVTAAQQQLNAADSELALAASTLKRYQALYERKSVSPQEFDEVKARQQSALARRDMAQADQAQTKAALAQGHASLDYTRIRAPFDGIVTGKKADAGSLASPGMPILTVEDVRRYRLEVTVNENDLRYVRIGQSVPIMIDALDNTELKGQTKGKINEIVPAADASTRSFLVKVDLPADTKLRSGLFGRVEFSRGDRSSLLIPRSAVVERGQLQGVFVLDQNKVANLRYVTLGKPSGSSTIEVLAGLQNGEFLVAKPGELDLNGKRIEAE
ncbi:MAG TPA: efflux RND transporter periplasmic adaptor subunit [Candidatus Sulfotelmatobacter sp.]|jgi:RND family efflux transporter MFP subunit